jgi:oxidoreductase
LFYVTLVLGVLSASLFCTKLLFGTDNDITDCSMTDEQKDFMRAFQQQNKTAFVVGYTGEVGKEVVKAILRSRVFSRLVLIGRRTVTFDDELYKDVEQRIIDFDNLDAHADTFKNLDIGYCCLGTTRAKAGADGFYRVDHDYVIGTAKLAKHGGCQQFHLISSQGANKDSSFLYPKTKGQVEEELQAMNFERLFIYRPAMLLCKREEVRTMEKAALFLMKPITWAFPTFISVPTSTVGRAVVNRTVTPTDSPVEIIDNKGIHKLGNGPCESADSS